MRARPDATPHSSRTRSPDVESVDAIQLSALRMCLDIPAGGAWAVDADGVPGRSLVQDEGTTVVFRVYLGAVMSLRGRVMLVPHDWRDGSGAIRAAIVASSGDRRDEVWCGTLNSAQLAGDPDGLSFACELRADISALVFELHQVNASDARAVGRAMWFEPRLVDPSGEPSRFSSLATLRHAPHQPLISVLTPVHDPPLHMLEEAVASVLGQTYSDWQLCLVDDGSRNPEIVAALDRFATRDRRIRLVRREQAGGIATATNAALELASGDFITLLDHDDTLAPHALSRVAEELARDPTLDMIYTDEDIVMDGRQVWIHLKPDWSPDTLNTNGYTCHLGVYRRELVAEIGGFRDEYNGSQDVDMILRLIERSERVAHIPEVLYHWRMHAASTAGGDAKPYAYVSARRAISEHLERTGRLGARVDYGPPGLYRVDYPVARETRVDLVLATADTEGLREMAESIIHQDAVDWKLIVAAPTDSLHDIAAVLRSSGLADRRVLAIESPTAADRNSVLAHAAARATADHLVLFEQPVVGLTGDWLRRLVGYSSEPRIGVAGPLVLARDGRIMHAGVALPTGIPLFLLHGGRSSMDDHFGYGTSVYDVSALSGVIVTRRAVYDEVGGLDGAAGELALVDYCLRAASGDRRAVIVPDARLRTLGPDRSINDFPGTKNLRSRWLANHAQDPFYSPNFRDDRGDFVPVSDRFCA